MTLIYKGVYCAGCPAPGLGDAGVLFYNVDQVICVGAFVDLGPTG